MGISNSNLLQQAELEKLLDDVASGKKVWNKVVESVYLNFNPVIEKLKLDIKTTRGGKYIEGSVTRYSGMYRDATDNKMRFFTSTQVEPSTTVNVSGTNYAYADIRVGDLTATTLTATNSLTGASISYPTSDGSNGQVLTTNGSGTLSFEDVGTTTTTVTTTATTQTNLDTWAIASFRSAHYQISISDATGTAYQSTELMLLHNGTAASISQYGTVLTGSELATFATDIDSGSLRVRITPTSTNSTVFKFKKMEHFFHRVLKIETNPYLF